MEDERTLRLENTVVTLQDREEDSRSKLQQILDTVARLAQNTTSQSDPILPTCPDVTMTSENPTKTRKAKPASPPEFDGDRTKGLAFLNSCQTYIRLCPKEFR